MIEFLKLIGKLTNHRQTKAMEDFLQTTGVNATELAVGFAKAGHPERTADVIMSSGDRISPPEVPIAIVLIALNEKAHREETMAQLLRERKIKPPILPSIFSGRLFTPEGYLALAEESLAQTQEIRFLPCR